MFFPSTNVKIFPCANRGYKEIENGTEKIKAVYNPESRFTTEHNLTSHLPLLAPNGANCYVYFAPDAQSNVWVLSFCGYRFDITNDSNNNTIQGFVIAIKDNRLAPLSINEVDKKIQSSSDICLDTSTGMCLAIYAITSDAEMPTDPNCFYLPVSQTWKALADSTKNELSDLQNEINNTTNKVTTLETKVDTLVGEDADKSARVIAVEEVTKAINNNITRTYETKTDASIKHSAMTTRVGKVESGVESLGTDLNSAKSRIDTLEKEMDTVEDRATAVEGRATALEGDMTTAKSDITQLKTDVDAVEAKASNNETSITDLSGRLKEIVDQGGEPNRINTITVDRVPQPITEDKVVNIDLEHATVATAGVANSTKGKLSIGDLLFDGASNVTVTAADLGALTSVPVATGDELGLVKSSDAQDSVSVGADGSMTVNTISGSKVSGSVESAVKVDNQLTIGGTTFDGSKAVTVTTATQSAAGLMSADDKIKLEGITAGANKTTVDASLSATSTNPVENQAIVAALNTKVTTEQGKGLSTNDFTNAYKDKLEKIEADANKYELPTATKDQLGGIKLGDNLQIDLEGKVSAKSGEIQADDTGLVTGGQVYAALQTFLAENVYEITFNLNNQTGTGFETAPPAQLWIRGISTVESLPKLPEDFVWNQDTDGNTAVTADDLNNGSCTLYVVNISSNT